MSNSSYRYQNTNQRKLNGVGKSGLEPLTQPLYNNLGLLYQLSYFPILDLENVLDRIRTCVPCLPFVPVNAQALDTLVKIKS